MNSISLSELNERIRGVIQQQFPQDVWVVAEVSGYIFRPNRNYHSFELVEKDEVSADVKARMQSKAWGLGASQIMKFQEQTGQAFGNNLQILARVRVEFHPRFGLQLDLQDIDPSFTIGLLALQRQQTLERLVSENTGTIARTPEGYRTRNMTLNFRPVIQKIALVSSFTSAGAEDFKHSLHNNPFNYRFAIDEYHTQVQGSSNAAVIRDQLIAIYNAGIPYDVVVITRGGGAQTDLLIFDDYSLARAVARLPIPVITGIGHQRNETIVDLMAHTSLKTPTSVADFIVQHNRMFEEKLLAMKDVISHAAVHLLTDRKQELTSLSNELVTGSRSLLASANIRLQAATHAVMVRPTTLLQSQRFLLQRQEERSGLYADRLLKDQRKKLAGFESLLRIASPEYVLRRGFALIRQEGKIITQSSHLKRQQIQIQMADGTITANPEI